VGNPSGQKRVSASTSRGEVKLSIGPFDHMLSFREEEIIIGLLFISSLLNRPADSVVGVAPGSARLSVAEVPRLVRVTRRLVGPLLQVQRAVIASATYEYPASLQRRTPETCERRRVS
jgi:hypothetical protein